MQNLHCRFDRYYLGQIYCGYIAKFCGILRIYEIYANLLYANFTNTTFQKIPIPHLILATSQADLAFKDLDRLSFFRSLLSILEFQMLHFKIKYQKVF